MQAPLMTGLVIALAGSMAVSGAVNDPVKLDTGLVSGLTGSSGEVRIYKGIPFAAPPVGNLRWRAPQAPAHWEGVRKAEQFGARCMQATNGGPAAQQPVSEDCLYVNVWTNAKSAGEKLPVMLWIYGGGYSVGSGSQPDYDGEALAKKGAVIVTMNYRLGAFGFFSHPELTKESDRRGAANFGMMDAIAALEWVQKNIAGFGGDPKRVTLFGESAGSGLIANLMASPRAKGLFHRVIGESSSWNAVTIARMRTLADAEESGVKLAAAAGASSLAELRAKPADQILKAGRGLGPVVDGWLLPEDPAVIFAQGKQNDVPVLAGSNRDEGTFFLQKGPQEQFLETGRRRFRDLSETYLKLYPMGSDDEAYASALRASRDEVAFVMRNWARLETKTGKSKAYLYYFTHEPPVAPGGRSRGATHTAEIPYVFGNVGNRPWTDVDRRLSDAMSAYWVNFAASGDPNGKGLPKWPAFREGKNESVMVFGEKAEAAPGPLDNAHLSFFQSFYDKQNAE